VNARGSLRSAFIAASAILASLPVGAACPEGQAIELSQVSALVGEASDGLRVGDRLQRWQDAGGIEHDACTLLDLARAELEQGTLAPIDLVVLRAGSEVRAVLAGGRHELAWRQTGDSVQAQASALLLQLRSLALAGDFAGARVLIAGLPDLAPAEHALALEQAVGWLEADPDRQATWELAERLVGLRASSAPRELARALAIRGRANLLRRDMTAATEDAKRAASLLGDERSLVAAQANLLLGALDYVQSRLDDAKARYGAALAMIEAIAPAGTFHANTLSNLAALDVARGEPAAALDGYTEALRLLARSAPGSYAEARVHFNRGLALTDLRRLADAEADIAAAVARFAKVQPEGPEHLQAQAQLADIYNARGQHDLAEARLRELLPLLQARAPGESNTLATEYTLAYTISRLKREDESLQAFRDLLAKLPPERPDTLRADTLNAYGQVLTTSGAKEESLAPLGEALALYDARGRRGLPTASALIARGETLRELGRLDEAGSDLSRALELRSTLAPGSVLEAVAHHVLGKLSRARGDVDDALSRYHRAIEMLERERWLQSENAELRALWTASYADFYREPLDLLLEAGRLPQAFELDQRYRGRELAMALARRGTGIDPALASDQVRDLASARAMLGEHQALIAFVALRDHTWTLLLDRKRLQAKRLPQGKAYWRAETDALNVLLALPQPNAVSQQAAIERSHRLHQALFAAWNGALDGVDQLLLVPDDALHEVAFAALVVEPALRAADARFLVEDHALAVAVRAFADAEGTRVAAPALLALGDPVGTDQEARGGDTLRLRGVGASPLPAARREAIGIADLYGRHARALVGAAAVEESVAASTAGVLHFATHVVLDSLQPLDSYVLLAAGATSDGRLRAHEIASAPRVARELVVLAGCASAQGTPAAGEGLLGIARAWHVAGAERVLASAWAIDDEATSKFMLALHQELRTGVAPEVALARTQRRWLARARENPWWREDRSGDALPFYWGGFQLSSTRP
jgi:CHAT domain-containing protein/Tfp pilus assembly protein PilF